MKSFFKNLTGFVLMFSTLIIGCDDESDTYYGELINNGDVESGTTEPNKWYKSNNPNYSFDWVDSESFSDNHSLKIEVNTEDNLHFGYWRQTIIENIPEDKIVKLKAKIKGDLSGEGVSLAIEGYWHPGGSNASYRSTRNIIAINGNFDWTDYELSAYIPDDTNRIVVYLICLPNTTGQVYFDDISLKVKE